MIDIVFPRERSSFLHRQFKKRSGNLRAPPDPYRPLSSDISVCARPTRVDRSRSLPLKPGLPMTSVISSAG